WCGSTTPGARRTRRRRGGRSWRKQRPVPNRRPAHDEFFPVRFRRGVLFPSPSCEHSLAREVPDTNDAQEVWHRAGEGTSRGLGNANKNEKSTNGKDWCCKSAAAE